MAGYGDLRRSPYQPAAHFFISNSLFRPDLACFIGEGQNKRSVAYLIEKSYLQAPEFSKNFRAKSSHANNSWEDVQTFDILRTLLTMASIPFGCNMTSSGVVDDFEVRYKLGLTYEPPKFVIKILKSNQRGQLDTTDIGKKC